MKDIIIIGNGPAGISAALYTIRAGFDTLIIGKDRGSLGKGDQIENYYGFVNPISGKDLVDRGIAQARRLGGEVISEEVVGIGFDTSLFVTTNKGKYNSTCIIIATGSTRATPKIKGIAELEGRGVSYCASCDGFFYRGKNVAVLGNGEFAAHEAAELAPVAKSVTILTNGLPLEDISMPQNVQVREEAIAEINGADAVEGIAFHNGDYLPIDGLFIAMGVAGSADLAKKIGAQTDGNKIVVDASMATNIPGLFAAGDCTGGMLKIPKAVHEGAVAGTSASAYLRKLRMESK